MNKTQLLENMRKEREIWNDLFTQISPSRLSEPGIMGEWTPKDLIAHITWTEAETVGIVRARALIGSDWWRLPLDERNQRIYEQHKDDELEAVEVRAFQVFADLEAAVGGLTDADLNLELLPGIPIWEQVSRNTFGHYRQHKPDVEAFVARGDMTVSRAEIISRMSYGWNRLHAYLKTLSEDQLTQPTDAGGWTIKDHLAHLGAWEDGVDALLNKQSRPERMGLDDAAWASDGFDLKNDIIKKQHQDKALAEVLKAFETIHHRLISTIQSLADADLMSPYKSYAPDSSTESPVFGSIVGNTYGHYAEHLPWIAAIVAKDSQHHAT